MSLDRTEVLHKRGEIGEEAVLINAIIHSAEFKVLSDKAKLLLCRQYEVLIAYFKVLDDRIEEMDNPSPEIGEPVDYSKAAPPTDYSSEKPETSLFEKLRAWLS